MLPLITLICIFGAPATRAADLDIIKWQVALDRAVTDGRVVPIRAARIRDLLDAAVAGRPIREVR